MLIQFNTKVGDIVSKHYKWRVAAMIIALENSFDEFMWAIENIDGFDSYIDGEPLRVTCNMSGGDVDGICLQTVNGQLLPAKFFNYEKIKEKAMEVV